MKRNEKPSHADCPVRYRRGGADYCGATDTPCAYCADYEPNDPRRERDLSRARRRKPRPRRDTRDTPPFEDS